MKNTKIIVPFFVDAQLGHKSINPSIKLFCFSTTASFAATSFYN